MPLAFPPVGTRRADQLTIAAETWRWDGTSGSVRVSSGLPLKPGYVKASNLNQVRVYVGAPLVEQAVALNPLHGTFPDGSYQSIGIQYLYPLTHNVPVPAEIRINQGGRGTTDIAWVDPTYAGIVSKRAVLAPTDPDYLCQTFVTLMPLIPATHDTGAAVAWRDTAAAKWTGITADGHLPGTAMYAHQQGLWAHWCRTGDRAFYQAAYDWSVEQADSTVIYAPLAGGGAMPSLLLPYAVSGQPGDPNYNPNCTNTTLYNPELLHGTTGCGFGPNEAWAMRVIAMAPAYWLTAWHQFKRTLNMFAQDAMRLCATGYVASRDRWLDPIWGARMNFGTKGMSAMLVAYLTECTTSFAMSGLPPQASWDYATFLPWLLDALEYYIWNLGDYRDGIVGLRPAVASLAYGAANGEWVGINTFQLILVAEFLMLYYDRIAPDPRIPVWMTSMAQYLIGQSRAAVPTDPHYPAGEGGVQWVMAYYNLNPAAVPSSSFTATTISGSTTMTWTGGPIAADDRGLYAQYLSGPNLFGTQTAVMNQSGTTFTLNNPATGTGSGTYVVDMTAWYLAMTPTILAWVYAYTGDPVYKTWAERGVFPGNVASLGTMQTKQWGEHWGGSRMAFFYYYAGGQIRGTPGVHPLGIVNPPLHPTLG